MTPLTVEELTNLDLEAANLDVRTNADRIYREIFDEYSSVGDTNRSLQPEWIADARESMRVPTANGHSGFGGESGTSASYRIR